MKTLYIGESSKDFLAYWRSVNKDLDIPKLGIPKELACYQQMAKQNRQACFVANLIELRYEHLNLEPISDYFKHPTQNFLKDGYNYAWQQIPKEFLDFNIQGYRRLLINAMNRSKPEDRSKVEAFLDYNYKFDNNGSDYSRFIQHMKILVSDKNSKPIFSINFCSNITYLKKKDNATLAIKMPDKSVIFYHYNAYNKSVFDYGTMSEREICLLHLLTKGLSSRQIAEILFISPHTVDTHRRNLLEMTNCVDTTALIVYCRMLGII